MQAYRFWRGRPVQSNYSGSELIVRDSTRAFNTRDNHFLICKNNFFPVSNHKTFYRPQNADGSVSFYLFCPLILTRPSGFHHVCQNRIPKIVCLNIFCKLAILGTIKTGFQSKTSIQVISGLPQLSKVFRLDKRFDQVTLSSSRIKASAGLNVCK